MKLYHGSTIDISEIDLLKSKPNKDFGKGFYLSADKQQAYEMASYKAAQLDLSPIVNTYEFDERALDTLYTSDTYTKLKDKRTGLYFQSPLYVYDFLEKEILTGIPS